MERAAGTARQRRQRGALCPPCIPDTHTRTQLPARGPSARPLAARCWARGRGSGGRRPHAPRAGRTGPPGRPPLPRCRGAAPTPAPLNVPRRPSSGLRMPRELPARPPRRVRPNGSARRPRRRRPSCGLGRGGGGGAGPRAGPPRLGAAGYRRASGPCGRWAHPGGAGVWGSTCVASAGGDLAARLREERLSGVA